MASLLTLSVLSGCSSEVSQGTEKTQEMTAQTAGRETAADEPSAMPAEVLPGPGQNSPGENQVQEIRYTTPEGETGYVYIPDSVQEHPETKVPMVLMMCSTGGEARNNARACGWVDQAGAEGIIVLAPDYNNYATYSETGAVVSAVEYVIQQYPVDVSRVYATGFSNGGAMAVALTSEYPQMFAAISAYGWMVDMRNRNPAYDMPFQVIQGTEEYTYETDSGHMAIMEDEQHAIRSLFLFNEMIEEGVRPDYGSTPYWGYEPDEVYTDNPDGRQWQFGNYYKNSYTAPFAQLVLIDGATHRPNRHEAAVSWDFFQHYYRSEDGSVAEIQVP